MKSVFQASKHRVWVRCITPRNQHWLWYHSKSALCCASTSTLIKELSSLLSSLKYTDSHKEVMDKWIRHNCPQAKNLAAKGLFHLVLHEKSLKWEMRSSCFPFYMWSIPILLGLHRGRYRYIYNEQTNKQIDVESYRALTDHHDCPQQQISCQFAYVLLVHFTTQRASHKAIAIYTLPTIQ